MLPQNRSEVDKQLEDIKTPLDKIDYLEVLSHELRNKLDWMKRKEAAKEPGNKIELSNRQGVLSAEMHVKREIKKLRTENTRRRLNEERNLLGSGKIG